MVALVRNSIRGTGMANPVEVWKSAKHGFDVWSDVLNYAAVATPMKDIDAADLSA